MPPVKFEFPGGGGGDRPTKPPPGRNLPTMVFSLAPPGVTRRGVSSGISRGEGVVHGRRGGGLMCLKFVGLSV